MYYHIIKITSELERINKQLRSDTAELESNVNDLMQTKKDMEKIVFDQLDLINDLSGKVEETTGILLLGYQYYYSYISP